MSMGKFYGSTLANTSKKTHAKYLKFYKKAYSAIRIKLKFKFILGFSKRWIKKG
jgi:hypothetical protein